MLTVSLQGQTQLASILSLGQQNRRLWLVNNTRKVL